VSDPGARGLLPGRPGRTLRAAAVLAGFLALFLLVDRLSGPGGADRPPQAGSATTRGPAPSTAAPTTTTRAAPTTTRPAPTTTTRATPTTRAPSTTAPSVRATPLKPADGVTVQILNGTGGLRLARNFKSAVRAEGYRIVNTGNAAVHYPVSTVYYTDDNLDDALSFRRRFPDFRRVARAPANLSSTVELHVIIGANFDP
jgi:LytR cell envelope-related transcriptional attenuator